MSPLTRKVIACVRKVPRGRVATYGQIAKLAGNPRASRAVVWILHSSSEAAHLPWHRIINAKGKIGFPPESLEFQRQCSRLEAEGIEVDLLSGRIDLKRYQYRPTR